MRRSDKEITRREGIDAVLHKAEWLHIAMTDGTLPYALCVSFGYDGNALYFHSAPEGRKMLILTENPVVCFEAVADYALVKGNSACDFSARYRSAVGMGRAEVLDIPEDKRKGLDAIMAKYAPGREFAYPDAMLKKTAVVRIVIESLSGKQNA